MTEPQAPQVGVRPWLFTDTDADGNVMSLTVIPTPDGAIGDAHSYRDSGYPHGGIAIGDVRFDVPEGGVLQTYALAAAGISRMAQLEALEVSVDDVPTAPAVDQSGQA